MKILILTTNYPSENVPVSGNFVEHQTKALKKSGHDVKVLQLVPLFSNKKLIPNSFKKTENIDGIQVYRLWIISLSLFFFPLQSWLLKRRIKKKFQTLDFDVDLIHAHFVVRAGIAASAIKEKFGIPYVITEHASFINRVLRLDFNNVKAAFFNANAVISVSNYLKGIIQKILPTLPIKVIPNLVHISPFNQSDVLDSQTTFRLVNISSMNKFEQDVKGLDILFSALKKTILEDPNTTYHLTVIGSGLAFDDFKNLVDQLELAEYISFLGVLPYDEVMNQIKQHHTLIIASRKETFAVVGIEALSMGRPVIATKCGGPEEYITKEVGILIEPENPDQLCQAIQQIRNSYDTYSPDVLKTYVKERFSSEVIAKQIEEVYKKVLSDQSSASPNQLA